MVSAGRVLIIPKGAWNTTDTYSMLDLVSYNGSSYVAKTSVPANTLPTNTSYWQLSAYGGTAATIAGNFAPLETTEYASQGYAIGEFLVNKDNQFCVATSVITTGDEIIVKPSAGYNVEATDAGTEINRIDDAIDNLSASDIDYDGTTSGLTATDTQSAIDEVVGSLSTVATTGAYSDLSGKPTLGTAAAKDSTNSVTELSTDLVESGAVYTALSAKANTADLGTAAAKDSTNAVTSGSTDLVESGAVYTEVNALEGEIDAIEDDLTNIKITGSTNNTGSTIYAGTFFYKDGVLVKAIASIANGATLTANTNYKVVTAGVLNEENPYNLSGTERVVGHTSDGKTLYQKTLTGYSTSYTDSGTRRTFNIDISSALGNPTSIRDKTGWVKGSYGGTNPGYVLNDMSTATAEPDLTMQLWHGTVITNAGVILLFFGFKTTYGSSVGMTRVDYDVTFTYTKD